MLQLALLTNELDWMSWMDRMNYDTAPLNPTPSNPYTTSQMLLPPRDLKCKLDGLCCCEQANLKIVL